MERIDTMSQRRLRALHDTDTSSPALRACIHEFGSEIVNAIYQAGITDPNKIRAVVLACWAGAQSGAQKRGPAGASPVMGTLDWLLVQAASPISAATLLRFLWLNGMAVVPREPSTPMIEASIRAIYEVGAVTKTEKHRIRLRDAIDVSMRRLFPQVFT